MRQICAIFFIVFLISGCAPVHVYKGEQLPDASTALVKGSVGPGKGSTWVQIDRIDGKPPKHWNPDHSFRLLPGTHKFSVHCLEWMGLGAAALSTIGLAPINKESPRTSISFTIKGGGNYVIKGKSQQLAGKTGYICIIQVEDLATGNIIKERRVRY